MGDEKNTPTRPRRLMLALVAVLLVGIVLGVVTDRAYLQFAQRTTDPRLIGDWVSEEGDVSFRPDRTFEAAHVFTVTANGSVAKTKQNPYVAQYRWVDRGTIEIYVPFLGEWLRQGLVFEGDQLTLLGKDGGAIRYTRKKD